MEHSRVGAGPEPGLQLSCGPLRPLGSSVCVRHPFSAKPLPDLQEAPHLPAPLPPDTTPGLLQVMLLKSNLVLCFRASHCLFLGLKAGC